MSDTPVTTILILAANPQNSSPLRLDEEVREIDEGLRLAKYRERFSLAQKWAVRPQDLQRAILDLNPQIVHFSGHGVGEAQFPPERASAIGGERKLVVEEESAGGLAGGLALENDRGQVQLVGTAALASLFELVADQVQCVLLNACYSDAQAVAIAQHIPYVIGMNKAVGDVAARVFAVAFYDALGAGRDIEFAFNSGRVAIGLQGIPETLTPVLRKRGVLTHGLAPTDVQPAAIPQPAQPSNVSLESPEGQVGIDSRFYVNSPFEERCYEEVKKSGSLIRIKSPHQMGKSSLMSRVLDYASQQGYRAVTIDLDQTNQKFFDDLDKFMQWFCASVGKPLGIKVKTEDYWDDIFGANDNSTDYFENYLLKEADPPLVLAIDNFDRVFQHIDIETDFCGLLRGWHERSKTKKQWEKLRLIVVHSQESYAQRDINQSPFNVGLPIELGEFTMPQVQDLVVRHGLSWAEGDLNQFMGLLSGHPYMVRSALYHLAVGDFTLDQFLKTAATEAGVYSDLLRGHLTVLEQHPNLGAAMKKVVESDTPVRLRTEELFKLDSMGLIKPVENDVSPRCNLYRQYFQARLGGEG